MTGGAARHRFGKGSRIASKHEFARVFDHGKVVVRGPLKAIGLATDLGRPRLGIVMPRRVGLATRRNRIKRLIREAFRLRAGNSAIDLVVVVRPHAPMKLADYRHLLEGIYERLEREWRSSPAS